MPRPLPSDSAESSTLTSLVGWAASLGICDVCHGAFIPYAAAFGTPTLVVFGVWFSVLYFTSPLGRERTSRRAVLVRIDSLSGRLSTPQPAAVAQRSDSEFRSDFASCSNFRIAGVGLDGEMQREKEAR